MNGRIDLEKGSGTPHGLYQEDCNPELFTQESIRGAGIELSPLSRLFFSKPNYNALQDGIRYLVYKKTLGEHTIGRQSPDDLLTVMRSVYLQYSRNLEIDLVPQVKELNGYVLEYCVPRILAEIQMYVTYRKDIQTLPTPLDRSSSENVKGTKSVEFKSF